jgi:hypothetical protein
MRKLVLAAFNSSYDGFVIIDGKEYNKSSLLQLLDDPHIEENWDFHQKVWKEEQVLTLLEDRTIDLDKFFKQLSQIEWAKGNLYFSRAFAPIYASILKKYLEPLNPRRAAFLLSYSEYIMPVDIEEAFRPLQNYLQQTFKVLKNTSLENFRANRAEIEFLEKKEFSILFNAIPDYFYELKEDIVHAIVNLIVAIQKHEKRVVKVYSAELVKLQLQDPLLMNTIEQNDKILQGKDGSGFSWWWIWAAVMIGRAIMNSGC